MDKARTWRFQPATLDGKPSTVEMELTFNFGLIVCDNPFAQRKSD
jgi:hypothetical protein